MEENEKIAEMEDSLTGGEEQILDISSDLIRGHINTIILRSLYDGDKYGYDIINEIEKKSGGMYSLKQPTLYSALKRLESLKYVTSYYGDYSNGGRRKYFSLTDLGKRITEQNLSEWEFSRTIIDSLISDGQSHYDFSFIKEKQKELLELKRALAAREAALEDEKTALYYRDKVILITGGGGSIGSELCRQLAKMEPKQIILLDIYENGVYDVQQELRIAYGNQLDLRLEIVSITNKPGLRRVFEAYHPQIVINAAAHKHVPLMERNCIEAVENNVFGTKNLVELCEEYRVQRFMMVSTDKAVNPTNVMGATKRMCEMIVMSAATHGRVKYSATRFGNVLGSAGSVIPLFRKQIANGGPVTITDKRIVRYFMTIPEASQLVLESGAMAKNGELFVLDMGQPVKILDLAEHMIRLSGSRNIEIVEVGLRPGEKLYEELLVKTEELDKTENSLIFIEREEPVSWAEIEEKLNVLHHACRSGSDERVRAALKQVVPTYKTPEEVNANAEQAEEMRCRKEPVSL